MHQGIKTHQCQICNKTYSENYRLLRYNNHSKLKVVHNAKIYICTLRLCASYDTKIRPLSYILLNIKGISRGPEAVQSHQNNSCYKSVLCFIQPTIDPWTCRVLVPLNLEGERNEVHLSLSGSAPSQTSLGQTPTFSTGGKVLYSNISPIEFVSGRLRFVLVHGLRHDTHV